MPILSNPRHERFAQELAKGLGQAAAYAAAGYSGNASAASKLLHRDAKILSRVAELQGAVAEQTTTNLAVTRSTLLAELKKIGFASDVGDVRASDKRAALMNYAQIEGWVIERHEHGGVGEFERLSDDELHEFILQDEAVMVVPVSGSDTEH